MREGKPVFKPRLAARVALPLAATGGLAALALTGPAMSAAPAVAAHSSTVRVAPDLGRPGGAAQLRRPGLSGVPMSLMAPGRRYP